MAWFGQICPLPGAYHLIASSVRDSPLCFPLSAIEFGHLIKAEVNSTESNEPSLYSYLPVSGLMGEMAKTSGQRSANFLCKAPNHK